jgi:hypothetical protein
LAEEPPLRQSLETLRGLNDGLTLLLKQTDAIAIAEAAQNARRTAAVRQISRAMARRQLEQVPPPTIAPAETGRWWIRTWAYPVAAALGVLALGVFYLSRGAASHNSSPDASRQANRTEIHGSPASNQTVAVQNHTDSPLPKVDSADDSDAEDEVDPVNDGDLNVLAISTASYDVSSMFESQTD